MCKRKMGWGAPGDERVRTMGKPPKKPSEREHKVLGEDAESGQPKKLKGSEGPMRATRLGGPKPSEL